MLPWGLPSTSWEISSSGASNPRPKESFSQKGGLNSRETKNAENPGLQDAGCIKNLRKLLSLEARGSLQGISSRNKIISMGCNWFSLKALATESSLFLISFWSLENSLFWLSVSLGNYLFKSESDLNIICHSDLRQTQFRLDSDLNKQLSQMHIFLLDMLVAS